MFNKNEQIKCKLNLALRGTLEINVHTSKIALQIELTWDSVTTTVSQTAFLELALRLDSSGSQGTGRAQDRRGGLAGTSVTPDPCLVATVEGLRWPAGFPRAGAEIELLGSGQRESGRVLEIRNGVPR